MKTEIELWAQAKEKLHEIYGENPPLAFTARLASEKALLHHIPTLRHYAFVGQLRALAEKENLGLITAGTWNAPFAAWLLGASIINPMPPHAVCPKCRKVAFHPEAKDGWDIPEQRCSCGSQMHCDGHNIPFVPFLDDPQITESFDIKMSPSLLSAAKELLHIFCGEAYHIVPVKFNYPDGNWIKYLLLPIDELPLLAHNGTMDVSIEEVYQNRQYTTFRLCCFENDFPNTNSILANGPTKENFLKALASFHNDIAKAQKDFLNESAAEPEVFRKEAEILQVLDYHPLSFSALLQAELFFRDTGAWEENAAQLIKDGKADLEDIPVSGDDVYAFVMDAFRFIHADGTGIAFDIMQNTKTGRYFRKKAELDQLLMENLHLPDWFSSYVEKVQCLFPKASCIESLLKRMV